jgi:hypothetical protein
VRANPGVRNSFRKILKSGIPEWNSGKGEKKGKGKGKGREKKMET